MSNPRWPHNPPARSCVLCVENLAFKVNGIILYIYILVNLLGYSRLISRYYDSWWDEDDVQKIIERELRKAEQADRDRGRQRAKSVWLEDMDNNIMDGLKPGGRDMMDQTEKSVDRYLQAVLQKY